MKKRPLNLLRLISITAATAATGTVSAQNKIGVQFVSSRQAAQLNPTDDGGTPATKQVNWNYTDTANNGSTANIAGPLAGTLVNQTGAATAATLSYSSSGAWNTNTGIGTPDSKILNGYLDNTGGGASVTIDNIPFPVYNVIVYFGSDGNGRTGQVNSVTAGTAYSYSTNSNLGANLTGAAYVRTTASAPSFPSANYCVFQVQTASSFTCNIIRGSNNSGFHAIQIVEAADSDSDTMPDNYEVANGLNPNLDDRTDDLDLDGLTNFAEFQDGTKPNDSDTDDDGLNDKVETKTGSYVSPVDTGSDPLKPDTDADGINDGPEVNTGPGDPYVTNPVSADTDGDGYTDGNEILRLTDPTLATSNPSVVAPGRFGINFSGGYNNVSLPVSGLAGATTYAQENWNNAAGAAGSASGLVNAANASIDAAVQWTSAGTWAVADPATNIPGDANAQLMDGYLDTSDVSTTSVKVVNIPFRTYDVIVYMDGDHAAGNNAGTYTVNGKVRSTVRDSGNWPIVAGGGVFSEMPASGGIGNFMVFRNLTGGTMNLSATPTTQARFRAPVNAVQIISAFDTDLDGMPDAYEDQFGFNSTSSADATLDPDLDGLSNAGEYLAGTQPLVPDTDGDGINDKSESNNGTYTGPASTGSDPLLPDTDGDGLTDGAETNSNPVLADTDSDGYNDGYETTFGTNPSSAASPVINARPGVGLKFNSTAMLDLALTDEAGWILSRQTFWNNADASGNGTQANLNPNDPTAIGTLQDNTGNTSPMTVNWTSSGSWNTTNGSGTGDSKLINGYLDNTGGGNTLSLANIPYSRYDVIVYFGSDGNNRTGSIAHTNPDSSVTEYFYRTFANKGAVGFGKSDYLETTDTDPAGTNPQANFCRFRGQTTPEFALQVNRGDNNSGLFAVQVVESILPTIPVVSVTRLQNGNVVVVWQSKPTATYTVQSSPDLTNWTILDPAYGSGGVNTTYTDSSLPANTPRYFYRIFEN